MKKSGKFSRGVVLNSEQKIRLQLYITAVCITHHFVSVSWLLHIYRCWWRHSLRNVDCNILDSDV
jgi:hypothetical protein